MFEWLSLLPIVVQVFIVIIISGSILYVCINLIRHGFSFNKNNTSFIVGNNKNEIVSPHARCPHSKDIIIVLKEVQQILHQQYILEYREQMQMQMNFAEQKLNQIRMLCYKTITDELNNQKIDSNILMLNIFIFKLFLKDVQNIVLDILRSSFHVNHFDEMSEKDFVIFCDEKTEYILFQIHEIFSNLKTYNDVIIINKTDELIMGNLKSKFADIIKDIYQNARIIAIENKVKLMEFDEKINNIVKKYITNK